MKRTYNVVGIYFALFLLGFCSLTVQSVLFRELIAIFNGSELIYGLTFALWLVSYAVGSGLLGRLADRLKDSRHSFALTQFFTLILFPVLIYAVRNARNLMGLPQGILVDLPSIIIFSFFILGPLTMILGFQFALGSRLLAEERKSDRREIGRAYTLEAAGSAAAGVILSFVLLFFLNSFQIAAVLAVLLTASILTLTGNKLLKLMALITALVLLACSTQIDQLANRQTWKGFDLVRSLDSPYGKLAVIKDQNETSFFYDGSLLYSSAAQANIEELVHLSLLAHEEPQNVLLISGGLGETIHEILKHPVKKLAYVELDPKIIQFLPEKLPSRVSVHPADGIYYITHTKEKYDLVLVNLPGPQSALINRFYTAEFYARVSKILKDKGLLIFTLPLSADFSGREARELSSSILKTVSGSFKDIALIPGSTSSFVLAGNRRLDLTPDLLLDRWRQRGIKTEYFNRSALRYDLTPERVKYLQVAARFDQNTPINTDLQPISYYYDLLLWSNYFAPGAKSFFYSLLKVKIGYVLAFIIIITLFSGSIFRRSKLPLIAWLGFTGMTAQLIIILTFQAHYGYLYQMIGFFAAAYMGGLALGSFCVNRRFAGITAAPLIIRLLLSALILALLLLLILVQLPTPNWLLPVFSLIIGVIIGAVFSLAVQSFISDAAIGAGAGALYGADLLGSSLAAILVSIFFIPIYGLAAAGWIAIFCALSALIL